MSPERASAPGAKCAELADRGPEMRPAAEHSIPGLHGDVAVRVFVPFETGHGVIVYQANTKSRTFIRALSAQASDGHEPEGPWNLVATAR